MIRRVSGYTVIRRCGMGRYGVCLLVERDACLFVMKVYRRTLWNRMARPDPAHEYAILSALDHPGIPKPVGITDHGRSPALVMEYRPGLTLKELLFKHKTVFSPARIHSIGSGLLDIMGHLHSRGVVHGDISVSNVLFTGSDLSLVDFGLARRSGGAPREYAVDFSGFADLLLYLLYSGHSGKGGKRGGPWFEELDLTLDQRSYIKALFGMDGDFTDFADVLKGFGAFRA